MDAVVLTDVRKRLGDLDVVDGIDLRVGHGQSVALVGANGSGKSTTLELMLGLVRPDEGRVRLCGLPPADACAAGRVGAMFQNGGLVGGLTVRELVELVCRLSRRQQAVEQTLAHAGVAELADQRADQLSGGQTQRVRFALAIAGDPQVLVLDEPTAAMDVAAHRAFWATLQGWVGDGRTIIFTTHDLEEARVHAGRMVVLARGRVVADAASSNVESWSAGSKEVLELGEDEAAL